MKEIDIAELVSLSESGNAEIVKQKLNEYFDDMPEDQKGKAYVDLASVYLQLLGDVNEGVVQVLDEQLALLKEIDVMEAKITDELNLEELRSQLS